MKPSRLTLAIFALAAITFAQQAAPAPQTRQTPQAPQAPPTVSPATNDKLLASYAIALLAQQTSAQAQATLNSAVAAYQADVEQAKKTEKLPEGATFQVDVNTRKVTVVMPTAPTPPAAPAAPASTKEKK